MKKPSLSWNEQVALFKARGLHVPDEAACARFLASANYYRFSGYARYFQESPGTGNNDFRVRTTFGEILDIYEADAALRQNLTSSLRDVELMLRSHVARVIADNYGGYERFLDASFYTDVPGREPTVESCLADIERSKDAHIVHYRDQDDRKRSDYSNLPVWSAVESWSFGTLSKVIERGGEGALAGLVATSTGVAKAGFAYRVRSLVYLRNRCAHHSRLWNHSVIDAGPTPSNVRSKAKRSFGQFEPRSVADVIVSMDDFSTRSHAGPTAMAQLHAASSAPFWSGLVDPHAA